MACQMAAQLRLRGGACEPRRAPAGVGVHLSHAASAELRRARHRSLPAAHRARSCYRRAGSPEQERHAETQPRAISPVRVLRRYRAHGPLPFLWAEQGHVCHGPLPSSVLAALRAAHKLPQLRRLEDCGPGGRARARGCERAGGKRGDKQRVGVHYAALARAVGYGGVVRWWCAGIGACPTAFEKRLKRLRARARMMITPEKGGVSSL